MKRTIALVLLMFLMLFALSGCDLLVSYRNEVGALLVEVENSIFGISSTEMHTKPIILDKDEYGRIMYLYSNISSAANDSTIFEGRNIWAVLIQQKTDENYKYVYYYPDYNFIVRKRSEFVESPFVDSKAFVEKTYGALSKEEIEALKEKNDWGKPLDESKCIKKELHSAYMPAPKSVSSWDKEMAYSQVCAYPPPNINIIFSYLTSDDFGRHIYFFRTENADRTLSEVSYFVIFTAEGFFDPMEIKDFWNYQDELKAYKEECDWDKPIEKGFDS